MVGLLSLCGTRLRRGLDPPRQGCFLPGVLGLLAQVANGFEPDYSLIPEGDFRYEFDADNFEAVVAENLGAHPLAAAQRELCGKLFETDPGEACAQLIQVIQDLSRHAVEKEFHLISPARPAQLTRIAV